MDQNQVYKDAVKTIKEAILRFRFYPEFTVNLQ